MFMSLSTVTSNKRNCKNGGAYWNRGTNIDKNTVEAGHLYSEGGAYWKEGAKSNHYGESKVSCPRTQRSAPARARTRTA